MFPIKAIGCLMLLCFFILPFSWASSPIPSLPSHLKSTVNQVVLLDFYASWCGACKWMQPYVQQLEKRLDTKLKVIHIDVDQSTNKAITNRYKIDGTPTYYLYGPGGEPRFVMKQWLDPLVLQSEVYRVSGLSPSLPPPVELMPKGLPSGLTWVWFTHKNCCTQLVKLSETLKKLPSLTVKPITLDKQAAVTWMQQLALVQAGSNALLDSQGHVLFRADVTVTPETIQKYLVMFTHGEPSKAK